MPPYITFQMLPRFINVFFLMRGNVTLLSSSHFLCSENAGYHSVQNLLPSSLLSKNIKIKIYKTVILPVVLYGYETWLLTLREEHRLRAF